MAPCERAGDDQLAEEWREAFAEQGLNLEDPTIASAAYLVALVLDKQMKAACAHVDVLTPTVDTFGPALLSIGASLYEALHAIAMFVS